VKPVSDFAAACGRFSLRVAGWAIEGRLPAAPKYVMIVAPHTSNWDFPVGYAAKQALRLQCHFIAKDTLFRWPLGVLLRALGGVPVDRSAAGDVVAETARVFREASQFVLVITPEGTRSPVPRWKSGFHRIARAAGVPVFLVAFDYRRKVVRLGPLFTPGEDYEGDVAAIRAQLSPAMARHPGNYVA